MVTHQRKQQIGPKAASIENYQIAIQQYAPNSG